MSGYVYLGPERSSSTNASFFGPLSLPEIAGRSGLPEIESAVMLISWLVMPSVSPQSRGGEAGFPSGKSMAGTSMSPNIPCATGANDRR